jgi:hypothetical protein
VQVLGGTRYIALTRHGDEGAQGLQVGGGIGICHTYIHILANSLAFPPIFLDTGVLQGRQTP